MWLRRKLQPIFDLFLPLNAIVRELATLRELYELDLASRNPPIMRITEEPSKGDTEVTYMDDPPRKKSALRDLLETWEEEDDVQQGNN